MGRLIDADALRLMNVEECAGHTIDYALGRDADDENWFCADGERREDE